jgi:transposase
MTVDELCDLLLPPSSQSLSIERFDVGETGLRIQIAITEPKALCPDCSSTTSRVHGGYWRTLSDRPWASTPIQLRLLVRRFWCETPSCKRQTFTERLSELAPHYARTTARLRHIQTDIGLALGGAAGARRLKNQGLPGSRNTLLRRVRRYCGPETAVPEVVGIDDWSKRKGRSYGTIIVDLERHRPVDLLPDRTADTTATWMKAHPEIRVVARDRAEAYASGVSEGAPRATQVADRWHLIKNLREALETELDLCPLIPGQPPVETSGDESPPASPDSEPLPPPPIYPDTPSGRRAEATRQARRSQRLAQYERACELRQQGLSQVRIASQVGVSPRTLIRWCKAGRFPERQRRHGDRQRLAPYAAYLQQRWAEGCRNAMHLWREVRDQGLTGSYARVAAYVRPLRRGQAPRQLEVESAADRLAASETAALTARDLSYIMIRRPSKRTDQERDDLKQVKDQDSVIAQLATMAEDFTQMVRERWADELGDWLETVQASAHSSLRSLATGIGQDLSAVQAALTLPYSNGQTEGQVTRLKLLKRQMYGRANLDLLRQRVLYAT